MTITNRIRILFAVAFTALLALLGGASSSDQAKTGKSSWSKDVAQVQQPAPYRR